MSTKPKTTTVSTGTNTGASGLGEDFTSILRNALAGRTNAMGGGGIEGFINNIFSEGAGDLGGALEERIATDTQRQLEGIRSQFGSNFAGSQFGTPGAFAEGLFRSEVPSKNAMAIGDLQLNTLAQLLPAISGLSARGIPAASENVIAQPSTFQQIAGATLPAVGTALGGPLGGAIAGGFSNLFGGNNSSSFPGVSDQSLVPTPFGTGGPNLFPDFPLALPNPSTTPFTPFAVPSF